MNLSRSTPGIAAVVFVATFLSVQGRPTAASVQQGVAAPPAPAAEKTGAQLYMESCAACHGPDGKGREQSIVGFDQPPPDFSDCSFASREADPDWFSIAHEGGPVRAFSPIMPAFGDAISEADLLRIIGHLRTFCTDNAWPRGELNLPRAFVTEKAFPEDEAVVTTSFAASGPGAVATSIVYERRFGPRNQIELIVPLESARDPMGVWRGGGGDLAIGFKRAVAHSISRGYILAVAGELQLPTGDESADLSKGTPVFEPFVSFGKMLPADSFVQAQAGFEFPFDTERSEREAFWRLAVGRTFVQNRGFGRSWTPMVELVAARELEEGVPAEWNLIPQIQISLSRRQHILANIGVSLPLNQRDGRHPQVLFYLLWDWFDGGFFDGW